MTNQSEQRFRTGDERDPLKVIRDLQSLDKYVAELEARLAQVEAVVGDPVIDEGLITDADFTP